MYNALIIDDEPWAREVVKSLGEWKALGLCIVGEAEGGHEGLRLIAELDPHIVIMDMRMPGIDGTELLRRINAEFPSVKIIVMSGYDDFAYLKQAIHSRAMDYLLKPFDAADLNRALRKCVEELEERRWTLDPARKIPIDSLSKEQSDRYAMLRQRVFASLLELDVPGVVMAFERLFEFLASASPVRIDEAAAERIREDYIDVLERFLSEHYECSFSEISGEQAGHTKGSMHDLSLLYVRAIERIEARRKSKTRLTIDEVTSYIEKHYADPIALETIAHRFYVSKEHLSRAFKSTTGENLSDFIVRIRMEKAKELLANDQISIKHAARLVGYPELPYFHRVFKKQFGMTPGEFIRQSEE